MHPQGHPETDPHLVDEEGIRQRAGAADQHQVAHRLEGGLEVAATAQLAERGPLDRAAEPVDLEGLVELVQGLRLRVHLTSPCSLEHR